MDEVVAATMSAPRFTGIVAGVFAASRSSSQRLDLRRSVVRREPAHARDRHPRRRRRRRDRC
jgi:hypothetical protein